MNKTTRLQAVLPIDVNTAESVNVADKAIELCLPEQTSGSDLFAVLSNSEGYAVAFDLGIKCGKIHTSPLNLP